ncbi:MAG: hypothetical protein FJ304_09680 [Planctomycetes bacterium]|nr:hypothetical protein [Planctomycetota bacterium]
MPLLDHFHPPLAELPPWSSVATTWAVSLTRWLNATLSTDEFIAFPTIHLGAHVEADVAEYDKRTNGANSNGNGGVVTLAEVPPATGTFAAVFPDDLEVRVATSRHEWSLCGVIELVSGANKKEANERAAFVAKCAGYLQRGIGVVVVDVVTNRLANLHNQLMRYLGGTALAMPGEPPNYVASYRPVRREERNEVDAWLNAVAVGDSLPTAPFALRGGPTLVLDLESTYTEAVHDLGLSS